MGLLVVPEPWPGLLGLLPIALGVRALVRDHEDDEAPPVVTNALGVAGVTVANGTDNIAVYVPVLRVLDPADAAVYAVTFAVLVGVWCLVAAGLGGHPRVIRALQRTQGWLVPVVFIGIGVVILVTAFWPD